MLSDAPESSSSDDGVDESVAVDASVDVLGVLPSVLVEFGESSSAPGLELGVESPSEAVAV